MKISLKIREEMDALEMRMITSSFWAGVIELALAVIFRTKFFGYLGTGLILYALFHYAQLKGEKRRKR